MRDNYAESTTLKARPASSATWGCRGTRPPLLGKAAHGGVGKHVALASPCWACVDTGREDSWIVRSLPFPPGADSTQGEALELTDSLHRSGTQQSLGQHWLLGAYLIPSVMSHSFTPVGQGDSKTCVPGPVACSGLILRAIPSTSPVPTGKDSNQRPGTATGRCYTGPRCAPKG